MAVNVKLPTILRKHTDGAALVEGNGSTLREVLADLEGRFQGLTRNVVNEDGSLHRFVNVYLNDEDIRFLGGLDAEVGEGDVLAVLPAVAGGAR